MTGTDGLRPIVENLDREMARFAALAGGDGRDATTLIAAWSKLVDFLSLGPAPELGGCPYCGAVGMLAATRCGRCWKKLVPPDRAAARPC